MSCGIYKITNIINNHSYIGQSRYIERRWDEHKNIAFSSFNPKYNYPLYRSFRKYGLDNFIFEILELCSFEDLNVKEQYYASLYEPEYNQTLTGDYYFVTHNKLKIEQVEEIQQSLLQDKEGKISHKALADKYNVSLDTIQAINAGRAWLNEDYSYPLHYSRFDPRIKKRKYCKCGKEINLKASQCIECCNKGKIKEKPVTREELKTLIRNTTFVKIGKDFNCTDNNVKKWCDYYGLPRTKREIKSYSDEEWEDI